MGIESASDRAVFFDTDEFGTTGTYTPSGGSASTVQVIHDEPQESLGVGGLGVPIGSTRRRAHLRKDQVTSPNDTGDTLQIGATVYQVVNPQSSVDGQIWTVELRTS